MASRFLQALADREVVDVKMNGVSSASFVGPSLKAIGTQNLNSCMAVMMASTKGAVLAHIAPRSAFTNDPGRFYQPHPKYNGHFSSKMP